MACTLTTLEEVCLSPFGGIYMSYAAKMSEIDDITFSGDGEITAFTMKASGTFAKYKYTQDDSAYYNQVGSRTGNLHEYAQDSFFKFLSITDENQAFSQAITACCDLVIVHFLRNGKKLAQGVEYDVDNQVWRIARNSTKAVNSVYSGTSAEESRVETMFQSIANYASPLVDMTEEQMDTLAGISSS